MSKYLSLLTAFTVCLAAASAQADQRISSSTLQAMGLSGLTVMSDSDAMSIRGMGYSGSKNSYKNTHAKGKSWAKIELDGREAYAGTGSDNEYHADGKYESSGANFSEATLSKTESETVDYSDGTTSAVTKVCTIHVEAGGFSSAKAF